jgi:hypothetical protein
MHEEPTGQSTLGCLKAVLLNFLEIILYCCAWYAFMGPKGILVGIGQYITIRFALFFAKVFAPARKD